MPSPQKIKGSTFERLAAEILNRLVKNSFWRRVAGSGALGTIMHEPTLSSDVKGKIASFSKEFKVECKVGYDPSTNREVKSFNLQKLWLDKIRKEADGSYGIPLLIGKFSGAREGVKVFVVMDIEVFAELMNHTTELYEELNGKQQTGSLDTSKAVV